MDLKGSIGTKKMRRSEAPVVPLGRKSQLDILESATSRPITQWQYTTNAVVHQPLFLRYRRPRSEASGRDM